MRSGARASAAWVLTALLGAMATAGHAKDRAVEVTALPIAHFAIGYPDETRFGALTFIGGMELESPARVFGALSGLVLLDGGRRLLAITDDGLMLGATMNRDANERPTGLGDVVMRPMRIAGGPELSGKMEADTESIDIAATPGGVIGKVSFEGRPRVMAGPLQADGFLGPLTDVGLPGDTRRLRWSKGLESLAIAPADGPLAGGTVIIAERTTRDSDVGDRPGWVLDGPMTGSFHITDDGYDLTDAKFGTDGDLYVLERLFTLAAGVRSRLRRFAATDLKPGATLEGEIVFEATLAHQIDNMEGLAIWTRDDGRTIVSMISDDNRSFLQRTLYLEFELDGAR